MGGHKWTSSFLSPSRRTVCCCLKQVNSCVTSPGEHFPSVADHPPLLASSSLGFGGVLRSHFNVRKLVRFMRVLLVLRRLHLHCLHSPLARLSQLGVVPYSVVLMSHVRMIAYNEYCQYIHFTRANCDISLHMNVSI